MENLEKILNSFPKKFSDRIETKRSLLSLEKQIKTILEVIMKDQEAEGESAMISKKPLQGFSCASCEKGILNLQSQVSPYNNWNKLPKRDPNDRLSKMGAGFSRMLTMINPESVSKLRPSLEKITNPKRKKEGSDSEIFDKGESYTYKEDEEEETVKRPITSSHLPDINNK